MVGQDKATANQWNSDPNLIKQLTAWTEEGCYDRLAELWVKGVNIDWSKLRRPSNIYPRRISLPTYPFDPKRYWFELEENKSTQTTPTVNTQALSCERITKPIPGENRQLVTASPQPRKLITLIDPDKVQRDRVNPRDRQRIRLSDPSALTLPTKVTSSWLKLTPQAQGIVEIEINTACDP
jgi:acyl transferase domain-containing protein